MTARRSPCAFLIACALATAVAAGCGGDDEQAATTPAVAADSAPAASAAAPAETPSPVETPSGERPKRRPDRDGERRNGGGDAVDPHTGDGAGGRPESDEEAAQGPPESAGESTCPAELSDIQCQEIGDALEGSEGSGQTSGAPGCPPMFSRKQCLEAKQALEASPADAEGSGEPGCPPGFGARECEAIAAAMEKG